MGPVCVHRASVAATVKLPTGVCVHCHSPIVKLVLMIPPTWMHNPKKGFRYRQCRNSDTVATPTKEDT